MIRNIVAVADLHGRLPKDIPPCDLLLIAGDISPNRCRDYDMVESWLRKRFRPWLEKVPARHVVGVAGNHDFIFQHQRELIPNDLRWHYLQDSGIELEGVKIWGTPWCPRYDGWAFEADEDELAAIASLIPAGTDIVLSHCPPRGIADVCYGNSASGSLGSRALLERVCQVRPRLVVFGHAHTAKHGPTTIVPGTVGYNVACADEANCPHYAPTIIEVPV